MPTQFWPSLADTPAAPPTVTIEPSGSCTRLAFERGTSRSGTRLGPVSQVRPAGFVMSAVSAVSIEFLGRTLPEYPPTIAARDEPDGVAGQQHRAAGRVPVVEVGKLRPCALRRSPGNAGSSIATSPM